MKKSLHYALASICLAITRFAYIFLIQIYLNKALRAQRKAFRYSINERFWASITSTCGKMKLDDVYLERSKNKTIKTSRLCGKYLAEYKYWLEMVIDGEKTWLSRIQDSMMNGSKKH